MADVENLLKQLSKEVNSVLRISCRKFIKAVIRVYNFVEYVELQNLKNLGFKDNREAAKAVVASFKAYANNRGELATVVNVIDSTLTGAKPVKARIAKRENYEKTGLILMLRFIESAMALRDYCVTLNPSTFSRNEYLKIKAYLGDMYDSRGDVIAVTKYQKTLGELYKAVSINKLEEIREGLAEAVGERKRSSETTRRRPSAS